MKIDPLFHPEWVKFNERQWSLKSERLVFYPDKGASWKLEIVVYRNKRGQLVHPRRNPYLPVHFESTSNRQSSYNRRKRLALEKLALYFSKNQFGSSLSLSPVVDDMRPFIWQRMSVDPKYTYNIELSHYKSNCDANVINKINKARRIGYYCESTKDYKTVMECINQTELRKNFKHNLDNDNFKQFYECTGQKMVELFLCRNSNGHPKAGRICIYIPDGKSIGWLVGINSEALKDGASALLNEYTLNYLYTKGCKIFDYHGGDVHSLATWKETWGGALTLYFSISQINLKYSIIQVSNIVKNLIKR